MPSWVSAHVLHLDDLQSQRFGVEVEVGDAEVREERQIRTLPTRVNANENCGRNERGEGEGGEALGCDTVTSLFV